MEYIPGTTLGEVSKRKPVPQDQIIRLGLQLAEGLSAAHEHGVVHRDLKSANVRVTPDGWLKILDFGLAAYQPPVSDTASTQTVVQSDRMAGTLPYMAPEQLRGTHSDGRTDIYAAGVVLYEMATGRRPFQAALSTELIGDIQHKRPIPPSQLNPAVSLQLEQIILKCLEKDPDLRYQSAPDLAADFRRAMAHAAEPIHPTVRRPRWLLASAAAALGLGVAVGGWAVAWRDRPAVARGPALIQAVAVLPLQDLSGGPDYFVDGVTDELITTLGTIGSLRVTSQTSVMSYKDTHKTLPEIATELDVDGVIEGSVRRSGSRVRVTVRLIHAGTGRQLWSGSFERELGDMFSLQEEVAQAIADEISVTLSPEERSRLASASQVHPEAYDHYLQGRFYLNQQTPELVRQAVEHFEAAIQLDASYARAHAGLAYAYGVYGDAFGMLSRDEVISGMKTAAGRAVELDPTLAEGHIQLGNAVFYYDQDWDGAEREYRLAVNLSPSNASAHTFYAYFLAAKGQIREAIQEARTAQELDPLSAAMAWNLGRALHYARDHGQAIEQYRKALVLDPLAGPAHSGLGLSYTELGRMDEAIDKIEETASITGRTPHVLSDLGRVYALAGRRDQALAILDELGRIEASGRSVSAEEKAIVYIGLGNRDLALALLDQACEDQTLSLWIQVDPRFDPLRSDPRFAELVRCVGSTP